jgi:NAD(P)-dependent dehydrogenase (short-subunit alcohol dehydrogenase family)
MRILAAAARRGGEAHSRQFHSAGRDPNADQLRGMVHPEAYAELMKLVPYKRIGEIEGIGRAAVWLASDFTDYIVGTTLFIDGGMTLYPGFETGG